MMTPEMQSSLSGIPSGLPKRKKTRRGNGGKGTPIGDPKDLHSKMGERIHAGDLHGAKAHAFAMVRTLHALAPKPADERPAAPESKKAVALSAGSDAPRQEREARLAQTLKAMRKK